MWRIISTDNNTEYFMIHTHSDGSEWYGRFYKNYVYGCTGCKIAIPEDIITQMVLIEPPYSLESLDEAQKQLFLSYKWQWFEETKTWKRYWPNEI